MVLALYCIVWMKLRVTPKHGSSPTKRHVLLLLRSRVIGSGNLDLRDPFWPMARALSPVNGGGAGAIAMGVLALSLGMTSTPG